MTTCQQLTHQHTNELSVPQTLKYLDLCIFPDRNWRNCNIILNTVISLKYTGEQHQWHSNAFKSLKDAWSESSTANSS